MNGYHRFEWVGISRFFPPSDKRYISKTAIPNDHHIGDILYGMVFLLTTFFISHLFFERRLSTKELLTIIIFGIAFCGLYGDLYKIAGSICMSCILLIIKKG
ncbi:hypothetical protein [Bacteroides timonensis]